MIFRIVKAYLARVAEFSRNLDPNEEMKNQQALLEELGQRTKHIPIPKPIESEAEALGQEIFDLMGFDDPNKRANSLITKVERGVLSPSEAKKEALEISIRLPEWIAEFRKARILTGHETGLDVIDSEIDAERGHSYGTANVALCIGSTTLYQTACEEVKEQGPRFTYRELAKKIVSGQGGYKRTPDGYSYVSPHLDEKYLTELIKETCGE